jgi:hypothetical protein
MRTAFFLAFACVASLARAAQPDKTTTSPSGSFSIVEHFVTEDPYSGWRVTLHFRDKSKPDAELADLPEWYDAFATYYISPDEHWILRDQHIGAGVNALFLYRVDPSGEVWRLQNELNELAFAALFEQSHRKLDDYRHPASEFVAWDIPSGAIRFKVFATSNDPHTYPSIERGVSYRLREHKVVPQ